MGLRSGRIGFVLTHFPVAAEWRRTGGTQEGHCFRSPGDRSRERDLPSEGWQRGRKREEPSDIRSVKSAGLDSNWIGNRQATFIHQTVI